MAPGLPPEQEELLNKIVADWFVLRETVVAENDRLTAELIALRNETHPPAGPDSGLFEQLLTARRENRRLTLQAAELHCDLDKLRQDTLALDGIWARQIDAAGALTIQIERLTALLAAGGPASPECSACDQDGVYVATSMDERIHNAFGPGAEIRILCPFCKGTKVQVQRCTSAHA